MPTVAPSSNSVCLGQSGNISAITNGNVVNWSTGQQAFVINVTTSVTNVYSYTTTSGACSTTGSSTLFVLSPPPTPTVIVMGTYLTTTVVAQYYQWYLDGNLLQGETSFSITPLLPGVYIVWVANGSCDSFSDGVTLTDVGLKEIAALSGINVGPNPVKDYLIVSLKAGDDEEILYEIQNNLGQLVTKSKFKIDENKQAKLNVQFLSAGIYYLSFKKGESKNSYKFIKQ